MESVISAAEGSRREPVLLPRPHHFFCNEKDEDGPWDFFACTAIFDALGTPNFSVEGPGLSFGLRTGPLRGWAIRGPCSLTFSSCQSGASLSWPRVKKASAQEPTATLKTSAAKKFEITLKGPSSPSQPSQTSGRRTSRSKAQATVGPLLKGSHPLTTQLQLRSSGRLLLKGSHPLTTQLHPFQRQFWAYLLRPWAK